MYSFYLINKPSDRTTGTTKIDRQQPEELERQRDELEQQKNEINRQSTEIKKQQLEIARLIFPDEPEDHIEEIGIVETTLKARL